MALWWITGNIIGRLKQVGIKNHTDTYYIYGVSETVQDIDEAYLEQRAARSGTGIWGLKWLSAD